MMQLKIKTSSQFALEIEQIVNDKKIDYLDAVMYYVECNNTEIETVASFIKNSQILKSKIALEAEDLNMIKKTARLPI
jgi:hypothetical protein|tara:strand:- start:2445 stop:2678 length:234 start_codon:yes stop_codon:yes gene_type:complete